MVFLTNKEKTILNIILFTIIQYARIKKNDNNLSVSIWWIFLQISFQLPLTHQSEILTKKNIVSFGKGSEQITSIRNIHKGLYDHSAFKWRATGTRSLNECFYYVIDDRLIIKRLMDTCKIIWYDARKARLPLLSKSFRRSLYCGTKQIYGRDAKAGISPMNGK